MAEKKLKMIDGLIKAADVASHTYGDILASLQKQAQAANALLYELDATEATLLGHADTMERLRRNALALATLLDQARTASEYMRNGILTLLNAHDVRVIEEERAKQARIRNAQKVEQAEKWRKAKSDAPSEQPEEQ